jgi:hypothetical protein
LAVKIATKGQLNVNLFYNEIDLDADFICNMIENNFYVILKKLCKILSDFNLEHVVKTEML